MSGAGRSLTIAAGVLLALAAGAVGCDGTAPEAPHDFEGSFSLATHNGSSLPIVVDYDPPKGGYAGCPIDLVGGTLLLTGATHRFTYSLTRYNACRDTTSQAGVGGTYAVVGETLTFRDTADGFFTGRIIQGDAVLITRDAVSLTFRR